MLKGRGDEAWLDVEFHHIIKGQKSARAHGTRRSGQNFSPKFVPLHKTRLALSVTLGISQFIYKSVLFKNLTANSRKYEGDQSRLWHGQVTKTDHNGNDQIKNSIFMKLKDFKDDVLKNKLK